MLNIFFFGIFIRSEIFLLTFKFKFKLFVFTFFPPEFLSLNFVDTFVDGVGGCLFVELFIKS
jgi:hypothetical protein